MECRSCGINKSLDGETFCLSCGQDYILPYVKSNLRSARFAHDRMSLARRVDVLRTKIDLASGRLKRA